MADRYNLRPHILSAANELGVSPVDLATVISYETAGTFNPTIAGPTTQWGRHRGLIQWGEPQAKRYINNDFSPESQMKGVVRYMRDAGVRPGMGLLDLYSAVNAGRVGRYNASDANNGGAPGTVRDKVNNQMAGHKRKAAALIGTVSDRRTPIASARPTPAPPRPGGYDGAPLAHEAPTAMAFAPTPSQRPNSAVNAVNMMAAPPNRPVPAMRPERPENVQIADGYQTPAALSPAQQMGVALAGLGAPQSDPLRPQQRLPFEGVMKRPGENERQRMAQYMIRGMFGAA